jgi:preprotein translocase subunit SecG
MEFLFPLLLSVHILIGISVIGLVLLQHGKGADMGAAFGSGASGSLFGASGSANFLSRTTAVLATVFFLTSLGLSYLAGNRPKAPGSVMEVPATAPPAKPLTGSNPAPGAEQKPVDTPEQKTPAGIEQKSESGVEQRGAAGSEPKPAAAVEQKDAAGAESKPAAAVEKKQEQKPAAAKSKAAPADKKTEAAPASAPESKAKEIPK